MNDFEFSAMARGWELNQQGRFDALSEDENDSENAACTQATDNVSASCTADANPNPGQAVSINNQTLRREL